MVDDQEDDKWPKKVINIDKIDSSVDLPEVLRKVLQEVDHTKLPYGKRFQQTRFATILGAVYAEDSIYTENEQKKHLKKLRKYYDQNAKKNKSGEHLYLSETSASFYCEFLQLIEKQIRADYQGLDIKTEEISRPLKKEELQTTRTTGTRKEGSRNDRQDGTVVQKYEVLDLSKLANVPYEKLSEYLRTILNNKRSLSETQRTQLLNFISQIEYSYSHSQNVNNNLLVNSHAEKAKRLFTFEEGMGMSPDTQKLYVSFLDELELKIKQEHPDVSLQKEEISLLYSHSRVNPNPNPNPNPSVSLDGYTSDEWMQMLNQGANAAYNQANNFSEGIVIASLREIKGADFADRFANEEMTLENKEDLLKQLSPAELSKFSMSILKSTETLAEILPPHFMTMMAQRIDGALTTRGLSDADKAT